MKRWSLVVACVALALTLTAIACSSRPEVVFQRGGYLSEEVTGVGIAWGDKAREKATKEAIAEATAKALPRALEFTYLRVDQYVMFRTTLAERAKTEVVSTETLPDGGVKVVAKAVRGSQSMTAMRHMQTANITFTCQGETYRERWEACEALIYSSALEAYAMRNYNKVPEKMRGNFTFFEITREDNGKKMVVNAISFVGMGAGQLEPRERGMVLMNAWRRMAQAGKGEESIELYKRAFEAYPNANIAEEFALFEMNQNRLNYAAWAIRQAIKLNPYEMRYMKMLYEIYKKQGDTVRMAKLQKELEELEAWEDDMGEDITSTATFSTEIRWTNSQGETEEEGTVRFQDSSDQGE
jgi:hypothetical protein